MVTEIDKPKIIFIDWSGTLSRSKFWGHSENSNSQLFKQIEDNLFGKNTNLIKPWMRGVLASEDIVKKICDETSLEYKTVFNEFVKGCELMEFVDPEVPNLITKLRKKGIKVYIASNNMDSFDRWTIPAMKLNNIFDGIINSFPIKVLKHDFTDDGISLFFDTVLKKEKVKPHQTVLIDDSEDKENKLTNFGIDYRRISDKRTLIDELNMLLSSTNSLKK